MRCNFPVGEVELINGVERLQRMGPTGLTCNHLEKECHVINGAPKCTVLFVMTEGARRSVRAQVLFEQ